MKIHLIAIIIFVVPLFYFIGCNSDGRDNLFQLMGSNQTGIDFINELTFSQEFNIYKYRNFYNGGGVALGDINNDDLIDIYFTSNQGKNKLYINKGEFKFVDVTNKAGVGGEKGWSTGVAMTDVNGDGWIDIYVCNSGDIKGDNKQNELFINNRDGTFSEQAKEYGIADGGFSTHGVFFDFDKDGDLDLYLLNNSYQAIGSFNLRRNERPKRDSVGGDKLYENIGNKFIDISEKAGIYGSVIGFGLGVTIGDVNNDDWLDIYVSNDFFERDYLYINNQDGTFSERLTEFMRSISGASMGADLADLNNDGLPEIFVTEMLPENNARQKTVTTFESWDRYQYSVQNDYFHQFTRNTLQFNNGDDTFSEIGRFAGVAATDWSWGALLFDMDLDGYKDIFVANGIYQDLTNQDFLQFISNEETMKAIISENGVDYKKLVEAIPSNKVSNYAFKNLQNNTFKNEAKNWGLDKKSHSNGSAYGDLDNDGDLDLVVNNVNMPAFIYKNTAVERKLGHYLKFNITGNSPNNFAIGTKIYVHSGSNSFYIEQMPIKGFQSSSDPRPVLGLGDVSKIDSVVVVWPDLTKSVHKNVTVDQTFFIDEQKVVKRPCKNEYNIQQPILFEDTLNLISKYRHKENLNVDFDRDRLTYMMRSNEGPGAALGDVNGDNMKDIYICAAKGMEGALYFQNLDGSFRKMINPVFKQSIGLEEVDATFFDADGDLDLDLYVCTGGNEIPSGLTNTFDKLYINDGKGNFSLSNQKLPTNIPENSSCVASSDFDNDGDIDLFVGTRLLPYNFGQAANGYLLENDGNASFKMVNKEIAPKLDDIGMITDAIWADINLDNWPDLIIVGEWMPITVFEGGANGFRDVTKNLGLTKTNGFWRSVEVDDINLDGKPDIIAGNIGENTFLRASYSEPVQMYVSDFDLNGTVEQIITRYENGLSYPVVLKHDLVMQIPSLKKKYLKYENYKDQTINDIFTQDQLSKATVLNIYTTSNLILINKSDSFEIKKLPWKSQLSTIDAILVSDVNKDGKMDLITGGNQYAVKPQMGRYDASYGSLLLGDGNGNFEYLNSKKSGIKIDGQIREIIHLENDNIESYFFIRNNDSPVVYKKTICYLK